VAKEIRRNHSAMLREQRDHLIVEKRPGRNSVQQDYGIALAEIGPSNVQRSVAQAVELCTLLALPKSFV
jgi:hypothetical protein